MIAVDTNVVVRLLTADDEAQYHVAYQLFASEDIFIADTVILETEWVLRFAYEFEPKAVCTAFRKLFGLKNVWLTNNQLVLQVINWHEAGVDFADAFHLAASQQCPKFKTFDDKFIRRANKLTACAVEKP